MVFENPQQGMLDAYKRDTYRNVFIMMRYREDTPLTNIVEVVSNALREHGLNPILAKAKRLHPELWSNVLACMEYARYGIVIFEDVDGSHEFNPNIAIELGYMLARGRPCLILKDRRMAAVPTDIAGRVYDTFDSHNPEGTIPSAI